MALESLPGRQKCADARDGKAERAGRKTLKIYNAVDVPSRRKARILNVNIVNSLVAVAHEHSVNGLVLMVGNIRERLHRNIQRDCRWEKEAQVSTSPVTDRSMSPPILSWGDPAR